MKGLMLQLSIALKLFKRDWKRGELLILILSMTIAMASVSVIYLVIDRIETASEREVADVLGADLVIVSPKPVSEEWLSEAKNLGLNKALSVEFSSVLFANEKMQLASVQAVSDGYPLKGSLLIAKSPDAEAKTTNVRPKQGEIWVEPRIYHLFQSSLSQSGSSQSDTQAKNSENSPLIEVGYTNMQLGGVIMRKPGQGSTLFNIAPSAIINIDDLPATQIIQPGSRVVYRYLFTGEQQPLTQFAKKIAQQKDTSQRISSIYDESPVAGGALERSKSFIGLSSLLTLILLGVAIAMSASRYAKKQFDISALMRCFGMTNQQVLSIFVSILFFVAITGVTLGTVVGIAFQELLVELLSDFFVEALPPANYAILILPMLAALILLFGFALPSLLQIKSVPPMRVLRRQMQPMYLNLWLIYGVSLLSLAIVMWMQTGDLKLLLSVLLGLLLVVFIFSILAASLLKLMKLTTQSQSAAVKFSLRQLDANRGITLLHLLAFSITLFVIALVFLIRTELLVKWQQSLGENIPNHFLVNVKPNEVDPIASFFKQQSLEFSGIYPMIRGRIVGVNDQDIKTAISKEGQNHNSLRRELNITWAANLPIGNKVVKGDWHFQDGISQKPQSQTENSQSSPLISIEDKTAQALGLDIGDVLNFEIGAEKWSATIASIRSIDWQTFTPNFYVIANPGALDKFNATYISSFHLPKDKKALLPELIQSYPSVSIIEMDTILEEIQSIIGKLSKAIEVIMVFVIVAGVALLWAAMEHTFDSKYKQSAILRTLGASKGFITKSFRFEYIWMALLSAFMAVFAVEAISYALYREVFDIPFEFHFDMWWIMPLSTLILMLSASWRGVTKVTEPAPLSLIKGS